MQGRGSGWWEMFLQPPPAWWHFCPHHPVAQPALPTAPPSPGPPLGAGTRGPGADGIDRRWPGSRSTTPSASAASTAAPSSGTGTPTRWWSAPSSTGTAGLGWGAGGTRPPAPPPTLPLRSPQRPLLLPDGGDTGDRADPAGLPGLPHPSHRHPRVHPRLLRRQARLLRLHRPGLRHRAPPHRARPRVRPCALCPRPLLHPLSPLPPSPPQGWGIPHPFCPWDPFRGHLLGWDEGWGWGCPHCPGVACWDCSGVSPTAGGSVGAVLVCPWPCWHCPMWQGGLRVPCVSLCGWGGSWRHLQHVPVQQEGPVSNVPVVPI